jgi:two-component system chemotaxis response regulator CheB
VVRLEPRGQGADAPRIVPSADRMMETTVQVFGDTTMAVVLTGMGNDGSRGAQRIRAAGGPTVAESEQTAVIYGMPEAAIRAGAIEEVLPLDAIPAAIARFGMALSRND